MTAVLIGAGVALLVLVLSLALRRPLQRRWFSGTGLDEWREVARTLPWRDRWTLYVCNSLGRAAPTRLAALAVQRGEAMTAIIARTSGRTSSFRKVLLAAGVLSGLGFLLQLVDLFVGERDRHDWVSAASALVTTLVLLFYAQLQRGQGRLVERSVERSRALAET